MRPRRKGWRLRNVTLFSFSYDRFLGQYVHLFLVCDGAAAAVQRHLPCHHLRAHRFAAHRFGHQAFAGPRHPRARLRRQDHAHRAGVGRREHRALAPGARVPDVHELAEGRKRRGGAGLRAAGDRAAGARARLPRGGHRPRPAARPHGHHPRPDPHLQLRGPFWRRAHHAERADRRRHRRGDVLHRRRPHRRHPGAHRPQPAFAPHRGADHRPGKRSAPSCSASSTPRPRPPRRSLANFPAPLPACNFPARPAARRRSTSSR